ncbi:hypothetical protein FZI91_07875 [Mycobacterium sp. CBMA271]|uniref:hypothetical protein n=1 Tax=unclassified Mycobacteroides TaxID=2618759 RepID=UPI0012DD56D4|nr:MULTISPECIES: hypothetical protein [unclassified Mycobacteroides]MUM19209.1 hypothetical protein [Mycobacteroides sp. CBMA 326]MUM21623.1 hypothetical protein [Mycobacteroides sp. CBMA 271]
MVDDEQVAESAGPIISGPRKWIRHGLIAVVVAAALIAPVVLTIRWVKAEDLAQGQLKEYTAERQELQARELVADLNTHAPAMVFSTARVSRGDPREAAANAQLDRLIQAAMPLPGCQYTFDAVADLGEQGGKTFPWGISRTHRFDMLLTEHCPDKPPLPRTIGVIARPTEGGYWTPSAFVIEL